MTGTTSSERVLPGEQWVNALSAGPAAALNELIEGTFPFDRPVDRDAAQLLWSWLRPSGPHSDHLEHVDDTLAAWLTDRWERLARGDYSSVAWEADVWSTALRAVGLLKAVPRSSAVLAELFADRSLLGTICLGPARDPLADFLRAAAVTQQDQSYVEEWWALCDLRGLEPPHRGEIGILGIRHLPRPRAMQGLFHSEIVWALCRFGAALNRLEEDGQVTQRSGREHFVLLARRLQAAYPFPERWREYAATAAADVRVPNDWLRTALHRGPPERAIDEIQQEVRVSDGWRDPTWVRRSREIRHDLSAGATGAVERAELLLTEQRSHAATTGDTWPVVASASSFAKRIRRKDPHRALQWAREATEWDPGDPYPWVEATSALLQAEGPLAALPLAWLTSERFPWDSAALNLLGHVLMRSRQLELAEVIYRASAVRFSEDPHSLGGLAEVLKHQRELDQAETLYRTGIARFPENGVLKCGLAAVLRLLGPARWEEATQLLSQAQALPDAAGSVARETARLEAARAAVRADEGGGVQEPSDWDIDAVSAEEAERWVPDAMTAARAARSIRLVSRLIGRSKAHSAWTYIELAKASPAPASVGRVDAEEALLTLDAGDVETASMLVEAAAQRRPGAVSVAYAQARTRRAAAVSRATPFSEDALTALNEPWMRLTSVKSFPSGLAMLGDVRAAAALTDGQVALTTLSSRWERLHNWLAHHSTRADERSAATTFAHALLRAAPIPALVGQGASLHDLRRLINLDAASLDEAEETAVLTSS